MGGKKRGLAALVAVLATFAVALGLAAPAWAATITINQTEPNHSYSAYQILDGDVTEDANHTNVRLSNVQWGSNVDGDALLKLLRASQTQVYAATSNNGVKSNTTVAAVFSSAQTAEDFAAVFDWAADNSALAQEVANIINTNESTVLKGTPVTSVGQISGNPAHYQLEITDPGYYYIKDTGSAAATNNVFIQVFNDDKEVAPKGSTPTLEKKVKENVKYNTDGGYATGYNDTADYNIGDKVPFKLIGSIPDMSAYNNGYQYTITDTLSTSLDLPATNGVKVFLSTTKNADVSASNTTAPAGTVEVTSQFSITTNSNNRTLTIQPNIPVRDGQSIAAGANDLRRVVTNSETPTTLAKDTIYKYVIVVYEATLNSNAALGQGTIPNNQLNETGEGARNRGNVNKAHLTYSNNPSFPTGQHTATTNDDYVIVFTYGTNLTKASASDPTNTKLSGVTFHLYRLQSDGKTKEYAVVDSTTHKLGVANGSGTKEYWTTEANHANILLTSDSNGNFQVQGLDAGTYYVEEVSLPTGSTYNKPSQPWEINITAETGNTLTDNTSQAQNGNGAETELKSLSATVTNSSYQHAVTFRGDQTEKSLVSGDVTGTLTTGLVSATITNTQGFELPQTGGAGTIALTIAGVALAAGAAIVLTIRKRANDEQ